MNEGRRHVHATEKRNMHTSIFWKLNYTFLFIIASRPKLYIITWKCTVNEAMSACCCYFVCTCIPLFDKGYRIIYISRFHDASYNVCTTFICRAITAKIILNCIQITFQNQYQLDLLRKSLTKRILHTFFHQMGKFFN
jgi:hypothetical protein